MSTSKTSMRRLSVNAAFMKDIKDDNRDLKDILDEITPLATHPETAVNHWVELTELFARLRDQLALHFSLEEAYGYFDDAIVTAPQLSTTAECLRSEHPRLFERIRDLADSSLEVSVDRENQVRNFLGDFFNFRTEFEQHEEAELRLILAALDDDLGVGD